VEEAPCAGGWGSKGEIPYINDHFLPNLTKEFNFKRNVLIFCDFFVLLFQKKKVKDSKKTIFS
jgi:hypothetical protein